MPYDPGRHHRRSIRLRGYDYTSAGAYFITICAHRRECLFGEVVDGAMRLNVYGRVVDACWRAIPDHFPHVMLDVYVIMPNHVHGIIAIVDDPPVGARHASPLRPLSPRLDGVRGPAPGSLGAIIGSFKSAATRRINRLRGVSGLPVWQRNYYERIIRDDDELQLARAYVFNNPAAWPDDENHPDRLPG